MLKERSNTKESERYTDSGGFWLKNEVSEGGIFIVEGRERESR